MRHTSTARRRAGILVTTALAAMALVGTALPAGAAEGDTVTINLLGINDMHGRLVENETEWVGVHLAATVEQREIANAALGQDTLFFSAGDNIGASTFVSSSAKDNPTIAVLNAIGLDASTVGNHEFDAGFDVLKDRQSGANGYTKADFNYLVANVIDTVTGDPALPAYEIFETDLTGIKVGVVGVVTQETPSLVSPGGIQGLEFTDPVAAANDAAAAAKLAGADVVVLYAHDGGLESTSSGWTLDQQLAVDSNYTNLIENASADIAAIFSGHTHKDYVWNDGPIPGSASTRPIVQTGEYGKKLADVSLTLTEQADGSYDVTGHTAANLAVPTSGMAAYLSNPDLVKTQEVHSIIEAAKAVSDIEGAKPAGSTVEAIKRAYTSDGVENRGAESAAGHLMARVLWEGTQTVDGRPDLAADVAIMNPGGLRKDLPQGDLTIKDANALAPFANQLFVVTVKGSDLKNILEEQWQPAGASRRYLALGLQGITYVSHCAKDLSTGPTYDCIYADSILVNGEPLDLDGTYKVATNSFLAYGGDNFVSFKDGTWQDTGLIDFDALVAYLTANPGLAPDLEPRDVEQPEDLSGVLDVVVGSAGITFYGSEGVSSMFGAGEGHVWLSVTSPVTIEREVTVTVTASDGREYESTPVTVPGLEAGVPARVFLELSSVWDDSDTPWSVTVTAATPGPYMELRTGVTIEVPLRMTLVPLISDRFPNLELDVAAAKPGQTVSFSGDRYLVGETVTVTLNSTPVVVATVTADAQGSIRGSFVVPMDTTPGVHHLVARDSSEEFGTAALTINAMPLSLPPTGSDEAGLFAPAAALILVGAAMVVARRRVKSKFMA